ncbi:cyclin-like protein, partial [Dissophora ornata]
MSSPGETLFLAVHILDRVITRRMHYPERSNRLHRDHRVIGLVCLMIAGKYEEMTNHNYRLLMFLHIAKGLKLQGEIDVGILQRNERDVLKILDYRLGWPGPLSFLRRCSRADEGDQFARTGAKFVLELMMLDIRFLHYMPSLQAAAAIFVARFALGRTAWNSSMAQYSGYEAKDIDPVVHDIVMLLREEEASDTFPYYKYCTRVNYRISKFMLNWAQRLKNLDLLQQLYR